MNIHQLKIRLNVEYEKCVEHNRLVIKSKLTVWLQIDFLFFLSNF